MRIDKEFETTQETSERLNVTARTIQKWAATGKIPGAIKYGNVWMIPKGITTSFDVTYDPTGIWFGRICDALPYTDYLFASFEEAKELSHGLEAPDKIANFFYSNQFKGTFVLKLDKRGCFIANRDQTCNIPACEVLSVVDTTGAGDAFVSAFLFGIINGLSDEESGILGNVNGALAITKLGATSSTANLQNLVSTLQKDYTVHPLKNKLIEKMEMLAFDRTNNAIQV